MSWSVSREEGGSVLVEADYVLLTDLGARELAEALVAVASRHWSYIDGWGSRISAADETGETPSEEE